MAGSIKINSLSQRLCILSLALSLLFFALPLSSANAQTAFFYGTPYHARSYDWCYVFDFTIDSQDFYSGWAGNNNEGTYFSPFGWRADWVGNQYRSFVGIDTPAFTAVAVEIFSIDPAGGTVMARTTNAFLGFVSFLTDQQYTITLHEGTNWNLPSGIGFRHTENVAPFDGTHTVQAMKVYGINTNPFPANNCQTYPATPTPTSIPDNDYESGNFEFVCPQDVVAPEQINGEYARACSACMIIEQTVEPAPETGSETPYPTYDPAQTATYTPQFQTSTPIARLGTVTPQAQYTATPAYTPEPPVSDVCDLSLGNGACSWVEKTYGSWIPSGIGSADVPSTASYYMRASGVRLAVPRDSNNRPYYIEYIRFDYEINRPTYVGLNQFYGAYTVVGLENGATWFDSYPAPANLTDAVTELFPETTIGQTYFAFPPSGIGTIEYFVASSRDLDQNNLDGSVTLTSVELAYYESPPADYFDPNAPVQCHLPENYPPSSYEDYTISLSLPVISNETECYLLIPSFNFLDVLNNAIDFLESPFIDGFFGMPQVSICYRLVLMPQVSIFGFSFSFGYLISAMVLAVIIRWIRMF